MQSQGGYPQQANAYRPPPGSPYDQQQLTFPTPSTLDYQAQNASQGPYAPGLPKDPSATPDKPPTGMAAFTAKLKNIAPGQSTEALLNPPPPSFLRPPPHVAFPPFEPIALIGPSERLDKGFVVELPVSRESPHPFAMHDVREEDWTRFLGDLKKAAALTTRDKIVSNVAPMAAGIGISGEH